LGRKQDVDDDDDDDDDDGEQHPATSEIAKPLRISRSLAANQRGK